MYEIKFKRYDDAADGGERELIDDEVQEIHNELGVGHMQLFWDPFRASDCGLEALEKLDMENLFTEIIDTKTGLVYEFKFNEER